MREILDEKMSIGNIPRVDFRHAITRGRAIVPTNCDLGGFAHFLLLLPPYGGGVPIVDTFRLRGLIPRRTERLADLGR